MPFINMRGEIPPYVQVKGGKNLKKKKNEPDNEKRLAFKEGGQEYAQVTCMLGNRTCDAICTDGIKRLCHMRGEMFKTLLIADGDIVLVGLRRNQRDKADVLLKYTLDEARLLKAYGEVPRNITLNEGIGGAIDVCI